VLVDLDVTADGMRLLVNEGVPTKNSAVVRLDAAAKVKGVSRLDGTREAHGLARNGSALLVGMTRADGRAAVRPMADDGSALADFRCVDDSSAGSGFFARLALAPSDAGFAAFVRLRTGASALRLLDATGQARP
jgi:hypothetical protein